MGDIYVPEWSRHVPNPFDGTQLARDFWEFPVTRAFVDNFALSGWDQEWLKAFVKARKELKSARGRS